MDVGVLVVDAGARSDRMMRLDVTMSDARMMAVVVAADVEMLGW